MPRRAVIDIGTNSVKLLVGDVDGTRAVPVLECAEQTRLGRGFYRDRRLRPTAIGRTARAVARYAERAAQAGAQDIRLIATSAAREARNCGELLAAVERAASRPVEILSAHQEAEWVYRGVSTDPRLPDAPRLVIDVGGGSAEFGLGQDQKILWRGSFSLGTVRWLEQLQLSDPPSPDQWDLCRQELDDFCRVHLEPALEPVLAPWPRAQVTCIGACGTTTILARIHLSFEGYDRERLEAVRLRPEDLGTLRERLWSVPLEARRRIPGLPPDRADVILTGVAICEILVEHFRFHELRASTRGLRFAALLGLPPAV